MAETRYWYVSLDSDHDISTDTLELSLDGTTYADAETVTTPPATAAGLAAPSTGRTRYWWRILLGPDQTLKPSGGRTTLRGRLTDTPEILEPSWVIRT